MHGAVGRDDATLHRDLLDPGAHRQRCQSPLQPGELLRGCVDHRPDVHEDVVHVELRPGRATGGAGLPDRLQAVQDGALRLRQGHDVAVLVAHDRQLAHLSQRDESLVGLVVRRYAVVEQNVLGRLQPADPEVTKPPQVQPSSDHRVDSPHEVVLDDTGRSGAEREVGHRASVSRAHGHRYPAYLLDLREAAEDGLQRCRSRLGGVGRAGPVQVEVDDGLVAGRCRGDQLTEGGDEATRVGRPVELRQLRDRGHQPGRAAVERVVAGDERPARRG